MRRDLPMRASELQTCHASLDCRVLSSGTGHTVIVIAAWFVLVAFTAGTAIAIHRGRPKPGEYAWFFGAFVPYPKDSEPDSSADKTRADIAAPVAQQATEPPSDRTSS